MKKYFTLCLLLILSTGMTTLAQKKALYSFPLGIESYTFRNSFPKNIVKTLDTVQRLGFTEYEGGSYGMDPQAFKKLCKERGIKIISTGADYEGLVKSPEDIAHTAKRLGAKYVMCA